MSRLPTQEQWDRIVVLAEDAALDPDPIDGGIWKRRVFKSDEVMQRKLQELINTILLNQKSPI